MANPKKWTQMFFFASDNPLAPVMISQLKAIKDAGYQENTNVVVYFDPNEAAIQTKLFDSNRKRRNKRNAPPSMIGDSNDPFVRNMIEDKIENLDKLFQRGVRYMTLTWNNSTSWATSAKDETEKKDSLPQKGLTDFGKQIVKRMNELGMMVDISHVGEQTFWDAINTSTKPVIASHSGVYNLCPHRRNLKDDQIKAIGKNGGVIHINFYPGFLDSSYENKMGAFLALHQTEMDSLIKSGTQPDYAAMIVAQNHPDEVSTLRPHFLQRRHLLILRGR